MAPFAVIREDEGVTVVLTRTDADRAGMAYNYVAARITLRVGSALTDIGLTALFSRILADAGISCNVIAGLAHDHLFVGWEQGEPGPGPAQRAMNPLHARGEQLLRTTRLPGHDVTSDGRPGRTPPGRVSRGR